MKPWPEYVAEHRAFIRWHITGRVNYEHLDDVTQDAIVRALTLPPPSRGPRNLGWLRMIADNTIKDHYRALRGRRNTKPALVALHGGLSAPAFDREVEARDELLTRLGACVPRQRRALWLHGAGYSHEEIAGEIGCDTGTVRAVVFRARDRARRALREAA